jgi:hypothetical protein
VQSIRSSFRLDDIRTANSGYRWVSADILPESDIDNVLNCKAVVCFQIDLAGVEVVLNELEEGVKFQGDAFLNVIMRLLAIWIGGFTNAIVLCFKALPFCG